MSEYRLPHQEFRRLHRRAYAAQQRGHFEVCGLLVVRRRAPSRLGLCFMKNMVTNAGQFLLDDRQVSVQRAIARRGGHRVVGMFHSHPVGYARLGPRDRRATPTNWLHLVHDVCGVEPKLWRIVRRRARRTVVEVPIAVERSPK